MKNLNTIYSWVPEQEIVQQVDVRNTTKKMVADLIGADSIGADLEHLFWINKKEIEKWNLAQIEQWLDTNEVILMEKELDEILKTITWKETKIIDLNNTRKHISLEGVMHEQEIYQMAA
jgi:hypothetical protein